MSFEVQGKTALVTGANRGIGKAIVESLLKNGAKKVYAGVRDLKKAQPLVDEHGDKIVPVEIDLEEPNTIKAAAKTASDVELVVSNAGVLKTASPLADDAIDALEYEMKVNVYGLIRMAQAFAPVLKANGGGAFVQMNSVASVKSFAMIGTYSASKAASYSITQALRDELTEQGTAILSVHPGPVDTDMADDAGFTDVPTASPTEISQAIIESLQQGEFHLFPDAMSKQVGEAYASFATNIVDANLMEG